MKTELPNAAVKHVVVLMLENRGFDHLMGWLYGSGETPNIVGANQQPFMGLSTLSQQQFQGLANPSPLGGTVPIGIGARSPRTPTYNTGEAYQHIMNQMWGGTTPGPVWENAQTRQQAQALLAQQGQPKMDGFVRDFYVEVQHEASKNLDATGLSEVMDTYLPCQMPVLSGLARYYAVSDEWYCSVPTQTNSNRAFSVTGTSRGMVKNSFFDPPGLVFAKKVQGGVSNLDSLPVSTRSIFEVLEEWNYSWKYYFQDWWPPKDLGLGSEYQYTRTMIPLLQNEQFDPNFVKFDASNPQNAFFEDIRQGRLPAVSWIEPKWGGGPQWNFFRAVGNDYHPVSDTTTGEDFVMSLYNALVAGPQWNDTLLIITFDENGGTYDHKLPPAATPSYLDGCPIPRPTAFRDMDPNTRTQYGFDFAQFGVRVPTMLISPRVQGNTLFRSNTAVPYDHTSILATILTLAQVPQGGWELGARTDAAPTFDGLVTGPLRQNYDPGAALKAPNDQPPDPQAVTIQSNTPYVFEYIGNAWGQTASARCYLGPSSSGKIPTFYYPTMVANIDQAVQFTLVSDAGPDVVAPIMNMSVVKIMTTEPAIIGYVLLTVSQEWKWVYYGRDGSIPGAKWQVRILNSRDPRDEVKTSDRIYFVSRLPPNVVQDLSARITPDPLQRLIPMPPDDQYATTRAGEWALWKLTPAPIPPIDDLD